MDELTELDKLIAEEETAAKAEPSPDTDLAKRLREEEAKKKHWREKAVSPDGKAYKTLYEELKAQQQAQPVPNVSDRLDNIELSTKGLDEEAIGFIKTYAKGSGKAPGEVLTDPAIQMFLEARKQKQSVADAIPASSSRTVTVGGKSIGEMTPQERAANWSQIIAAARKK